MFFCIAILGLLARLLWPAIGDHRAEIEASLSAALGRPIAVKEIEAYWQGWTPLLHLTELSLFDPEGSRPAIRFEAAVIELDLPATLWEGGIKSRLLSVSGLQLTVLRRADGTITVDGVDPDRKVVARWLLQQPSVVIHSDRIVWHDLQSKHAPVSLSGVTLSVQNLGEHHRLHGRAKLPAELGSTLDFALHARGDLLAHDWSGNMYVEAEAIHPAALLSYARPPGIDAATGKLRVRSWSEWRQGRLTELDGDFVASAVDLAVHDSHFTLESAVGRLSARPAGQDGWRVDLDRFTVVTANGAWPESKMIFTLGDADQEGQRNLVAYARFLRLDDVVPLLLKLDAVPAWLAPTLERMRPAGELSHAKLGYYPVGNDPARFFFRADITQLVTKPVDKFPGVAGLAGTIEADATAGRLRLPGSSLSLHFTQETLGAPIAIDRLAGELRWHRRANDWDITATRLQAGNQDIEVQVNGSLAWAPGTGAAADLVFNFDRGRLQRLSHYLPSALAPKARVWLARAIAGGRAESGTAVLRGPLAEFPFDRRQGKVSVAFEVHEGILDYADDWPRIEGIDANVVFEGRSLTVRAPAGKVLGVDLYAVSATIPDLGAGPARVQIYGLAKGPAAEGRRFVMSSPLRGTLGKRLDPLAMDGDLILDLSLDIPIGGQGTTCDGMLDFPGNTLRVEGPGLAFDALKGRVHFGGQAWSGEGLKANLFGRPVRIDLGGNDRDAWVRIGGQADRGFLAGRVKALGPSAWVSRTGLLRAIDGSADWEARIDLSRPRTDPATMDNLRITSQLVGLRIDAPEPLGKAAMDPRRFEIKTSLAASGHRSVSLSLGDLVQADLTLGHDEHGPRLKSMRIALGATTPTAPKASGYWLGGTLDRLSLSEWASFLEVDGRLTRAAGGALAGLAMDLTVGRMEALGQWFNGVRLQASNEAGQWWVKIDGQDAAGHIRIPRTSDGTAIEADLERLTLAGPAKGTDLVGTDPGQLPALSVHCSRLKIESIEFGSMRLRTRPDGGRLSLDELTFSSPVYTLEGKGAWQREHGTHRSRFKIKVKSPELGKLLENFGYGSAGLVGGETALEIDAGWPGTPASFSLADLSGRLSIEVGDGRLRDLDNGVGRIFGLLSVNTIWRRLSLDFSDLFKKGFSFDTINGDFDIRSGDAYTGNLAIVGPSARIDVSGRTGLATQDYDQIVTVIPPLSINLPIAGVFFGPPGIGAGAAVLLAEKMFPAFPEKIDRMLLRRYSVKGRWDDPVVERLGGSDHWTSPTVGSP